MNRVSPNVDWTLLEQIQELNLSNFVSGGMRVGVRVFAILSVCLAFNSTPISVTNTQAAGAYHIAKRYVGLHERKHTRKLTKAVGVNPRRTPWCGAFVGAVMKRAGKPVPSGYMKAASWKRAGNRVSLNNARKGDIVVVRTRYGNHVGFYAGKKNGRVLVLGGNQSNQVKISGYRMASVQSVRRIGGISIKGKVQGFRLREIFQQTNAVLEREQIEDL